MSEEDKGNETQAEAAPTPDNSEEKPDGGDEGDAPSQEDIKASLVQAEVSAFANRPPIALPLNRLFSPAHLTIGTAKLTREFSKLPSREWPWTPTPNRNKRSPEAIELKA